MDWDGVVAKFRDCAAFSRICPPATAERIIAAVTQLADAASLTDLLDACTVGTRTEHG
jgi:hypothetical protein